MSFDRKKANRIRDYVQDKALKLSKNNRKLLLSWCTGAGKTLASLKILDSIVKNSKVPIKGYIICKETTHLSNWKEDIVKHNMTHLEKNYKMFLYASCHKYSDEKVDFIILDECHAVTDKRLDHLCEMLKPDSYVIMLSATVDDEKKSLLRDLTMGFKQFHISMEKAIEIGLLPTPVINIHLFPLDNTQRNLDYKKSKNEIIKCTEREYYNLISKTINSFKGIFFTNQQLWAKNKWLNKASERKRFISAIKTSRARQIINNNLKGYRHIVFTGTKEQCEELSPNNYIHSDRTKKEVELMKNNYNNKVTDELYVVQMFKEAVNLVDTEKGLIIQLDNKKLSLVQRLGRLFRSEFPEVHIIVLKNTQDEKYFNNVFQDFDKKYINIINY